MLRHDQAVAPQGLIGRGEGDARNAAISAAITGLLRAKPSDINKVELGWRWVGLAFS
jgi:hypothetical protein